jgi:hypothetical protein
MLLIRLLPVIAEEKCFALKGGTAINLFVRNMPRLSVDIDLTYLLSHSRPMHEVLLAKRKDITVEFNRGFVGMIEEPVTIEELVAAREALIADIVGNMPAAHRQFLVSFERGEPDWTTLGLPAVAALPAVKWRQHNLDKLSSEKRAALVANLEKVLAQ